MKEKWKEIPRFKGVKISFLSQQVKLEAKIVLVNRNGKVVKHYQKERMLKQRLCQGYLSVYIHRKFCLIHRLMLETFVGECPKGLVASHKDDNKLNNQIDNLEWTTQSNNLKNSYANGKSTKRGELNNNARLKGKNVRKIRKLYEIDDWTYKELAKKFGVSYHTIRDLILRRTWKEIK